MHPLPIVLAAVAAVAAGLWQHRAAIEIWRTWLDRPEYSHGMLLPLLAAWVIWRERGNMSQAGGSGSWLGVGVLVSGAGIAWIGELAALYAISQYGLALMWCGILLAWMGAAVARRIWIVFVLLLLAVPPPNFILNALSFDMQLLSSRLGVMLTAPFGISVFVEGNVIDLGDQQLQVAEACDGLRYMFPLLTIGFLMAYFVQAPWWKRVLIFLFSLPLSIGMNAVRVALIILLVERWGPEMAEGTFHDLQGWVMFMGSTALLYAFAKWLARDQGGSLWRSFAGDNSMIVAGSAGVAGGSPLVAGRALSTAAALSCLLLLTGLLTPVRVDALPPRAHLSEWPLKTDRWQGSRNTLDRIYLDVLKLDDYLLADYTDGARGPLNLYVAYYDSQRSGASAHSPRSCIPGGGWQIRSLDRVELNGGKLLANRVLIEHGLQKQIVYYWFAQRGRVITNEYLVKWYILWDALTRNRTDGALVRISAPVAMGQSVEEVDGMLEEFSRAIVPQLEPYVPG